MKLFALSGVGCITLSFGLFCSNRIRHIVQSGISRVTCCQVLGRWGIGCARRDACRAGALATLVLEIVESGGQLQVWESRRLSDKSDNHQIIAVGH